MKSWQLRLLVYCCIAITIGSVVSFLLFGNFIGITIIGIITGLLVAIIPSVPWFLPPVILWIVLFALFTVILIALLRKKKAR